jgi:putative transposase
LLPHDFPPYKTVHDYYRQWRRAGIGERINTVLREKLRIPLGRDAQPSAAIIDPKRQADWPLKPSGVASAP